MSRRLPLAQIAVGLVGCLVLAGVAVAVRDCAGPRSYAACMIEQMRGQDRSLYGAASEVCLEQTGRTIAVTVRQSELRVSTGSRFFEPVPFSGEVGRFSTDKQGVSEARDP